MYIRGLIPRNFSELAEAIQMGTQFLSSGDPAPESSDTPLVPKAAFQMKKDVQRMVDVYDDGRWTKGTQASVSVVNNSTQT